MRQYPTPTDADLAALQAFADAHGRTWKDQLAQVYWYNARPWRGVDGRDEITGSTLHAIRNNFGPTWLYELCPIKPAAKVRASKAPRPKKFVLSSSPLIHTPGMIRWAINGYAFEDDRPAILNVFTSGWPTVPAAAFKAILAGKLPVTIDDEAGTVAFEWH